MTTSKEDIELGLLEAEYAAVSVHGILPLAVDAESGRLRFARLGDEPGSECVLSAAGLPQAQVDLFVFNGTRDLENWRDGVLEVAGNRVEVILPDVRWPQAALLVRHDLPARPGSAVGEAVRLRLAPGMGPKKAADIGAGMRAERLKDWMRERVEADFRKEWKDEIAALAAVPRASDVSRRDGGVAFSLTPEGEILGVGPSFCLTRDGDGYLASWKIEAFRLDGEALDRADAAAAEVGALRDGRTVRMRIPAPLVPEKVIRLGEAAAAVAEAVERKDAVLPRP